MFNDGSFRKEATPKRVFSLLKLIEYKNGMLSKSQILEYMQPKDLTSGQDEVKKVINLCEREGFIKESHDGNYSLIIDKNCIDNEQVFRKYINSILFENINKNPFYAVTEEMLTKDMDIYEESSFEAIATSLETKEADKETVLGWRFWASFLGYGFILNRQFVLNPYIRIKDMMELKMINMFNEEISIGTFLDELKAACPEIKGAVDNNELSIPLSLALTTLESIGVLELKEIMDTSDKWKLNLNNSIKIVTHVTIKEV